MFKQINCFSTTFFQNFNSGHIYKKDAECAETNEKFSDFIIRIYYIHVYMQTCKVNLRNQLFPGTRLENPGNP